MAEKRRTGNERPDAYEETCPNIEVLSVTYFMQAIGAEITKADRVGAWRFLRGTDKYQNEYLVLRHEKTGACAEMHSYSE